MESTHWWEQKHSFTGSAFYAGNIPPPAGAFQQLARSGIQVTERPAAGDQLWVLELYRLGWGTARLVCLRDAAPPPRSIFQFEFLTERERAQALSAGASIGLAFEGTTGNVLRDRKIALRFLQQTLSTEGVAALDHLSLKVWTQGALADELAHDADLDVEEIFSIHAVRHEGEDHARWVHTHGLAAIGFFDFDILDASADMTSAGGIMLIRGIAYAILEERARLDGRRVMVAAPGGEFRFVPVREFLERSVHSSATWRRADSDADHDSRRAVVCDPSSPGRSPIPSVFLSHPFPENMLVGYSDSATELMSRRARETYVYLRGLAREFEGFGFQIFVKLGYPADDAQGREHLWFEVLELHESAIDATLLNEPYAVSRLKRGDRGVHDPALLSDWMVATPLGTITPRNTTVARMVRENPDGARATTAPLPR